MSTKGNRPAMTAALRAYLLCVDELVRQRKLARVRDVAEMRGVCSQSASWAVRRLALLGMVSHRAGQYIDMTEWGLSEAARVRKRLLEVQRKLRGLGLSQSDSTQIGFLVVEKLGE